MKKETKKQVSTQVVIKSLKQKAASKFKTLAKISTIKSNSDYELVSATISTLSAIGKEAEAQLGTIIDPLQESIKLTKKSIENSKVVFQPFLGSVEEAKENARTIMLAYQDVLEEKKAKVLTKFAKGGIKNAAKALELTSALTVVGTGTKVPKRWTAIAIDVSKTPKEYLVPDESAIKEALKSGKKVNGWVWKQVKGISI